MLDAANTDCTGNMTVIGGSERDQIDSGGGPQLDTAKGNDVEP